MAGAPNSISTRGFLWCSYLLGRFYRKNKAGRLTQSQSPKYLKYLRYLKYLKYLKYRFPCKNPAWRSRVSVHSLGRGRGEPRKPIPLSVSCGVCYFWAVSLAKIKLGFLCVLSEAPGTIPGPPLISSNRCIFSMKTSPLGSTIAAFCVSGRLPAHPCLCLLAS